MSIAVRGNYTTIRRPASVAVHASIEASRIAKRYTILAVVIGGLLWAYGNTYSITLFLERQVDINNVAIQAQFQYQEALLVRDAELTSLERLRKAADAMGLVANARTVIGSLDNHD